MNDLRAAFFALFACSIVALAGCGGGGGGGGVSPNPPGGNPAPGSPSASPSSSPTSMPTATPTQTPTPAPTSTPTPAANATYVPTFQSSFSFNGTTYPYRMVGANPASGATTTIPTVIVPVKLVFPDGSVFDPTMLVPALEASPIFTTASFAAGTTQFGDAQMRSQFFQFAANSNYHVLLGAPHVFPTVTENVPPGNGTVVTQSDGSKLGEVTFNWFMNTVQVQLIQQFGIKPSTVAFFSTANTRVLEPGSTTSTFGGYHDTFHMTSSAGPSTFATIWGAMFTSSPHDVTHVGHEVVEWLSDPFYPSNPNIVPAWRTPSTNVCNSNQLEVSDPVTLDLFTVNGYTFEDAVFLSWFAHQSPSTAIQGHYDLLNLLSGPAVSC